jgi:hypothetical protein
VLAHEALLLTFVLIVAIVVFVVAIAQCNVWSTMLHNDAMIRLSANHKDLTPE